MCPEARQDDFEFDILDATKIWPEELLPVRFIGELELNRNPDEFFPQVEQAAFCTAHVVPGIGHSDDPLLVWTTLPYPAPDLIFNLANEKLFIFRYSALPPRSQLAAVANQSASMPGVEF